MTATVIRNGVEIDIKCEDILQGDLVKASRDCDVPCDLVLLKTSDPDAKCFVTTANLDGESNLKILLVPKGFPNDVSIGECRVCENILKYFRRKIKMELLISHLQRNYTISVRLSVIDR